MTDNIEWTDGDGDKFRADDGSGTYAGLKYDAIACIQLSDHGGESVAVFVNDVQARCLRAWLTALIEQASSTSQGIPHTDVPVKDDTK